MVRCLVFVVGKISGSANLFRCSPYYQQPFVDPPESVGVLHQGTVSAERSKIDKSIHHLTTDTALGEQHMHFSNK